MKFEYFQKLSIFMKLKNWKLHIIKDSTFEFIIWIPKFKYYIWIFEIHV
jgi:hypothetical protein